MQGRWTEARDLLAEGERILREIGAPLERAKLLCVRCDLEQRTGDLAAARATLEESEALASEARAGPESHLGQYLSKLRQALAAGS